MAKKKKVKSGPPQKRAPLNENSSALSAMLQEAKAANPAPVPAPITPRVKFEPGFVIPDSNDAKELVAPMEQTDINTTLRQIRNGTKFRIQYKDNAFEDLIYLRSMLLNKVVDARWGSYEFVTVTAPISKGWAFPTSRVFILTALNWSEGWIGRLQYAIEAIEILS